VTTPSVHSQRSKALDVLRAVAVLLVLGRHLQPCPPELSSVLHALTLTWVRGGWIGVDLFFVLSGFLVSGLLFQEFRATGRVSAGRFLVRRGFKIYPAFWVLILLTTGVVIATAGRVRPNLSFSARAILHELVFVQNYLPGLWYHTWSLAVEEHFYLLLPLVVVLLLRRAGATRADPFAPLPFLIGGVAIACLGARAYVTATQPFNYFTHLFATHLRLDALAFGVLLSYAYHFREAAFRRWVDRFRSGMLVTGVFMLSLAFVFPLETTPWIPSIGLTVFYVGAGLILCAVLDREPRATPLVRLGAYVGRRSYSVYLWHLPAGLVCGLVWRHFLPVGWGWFVYAGAYFLGSAVLGIFMARLIETPALALRERLYEKRAAAP
jgi:peptidoglycan/LPS O-acetylase OafA/YrhL